MLELLSAAYPWIKVFHIMGVISWMAGIFYLPRLFVYHAERASAGSELDETLKVMEEKLLRVIMGPAMGATWLFGVLLAITPGVVDLGAGWPWVKLVSVVGMTGLHIWLSHRQKEFAKGGNRLTGRRYRIINEVPTVLMAVIVIMVVVKPF